MSQTLRATGGCHCGAVAFEIQVPSKVDVRHCNCSMCAACGYHHLTVARRDFRLLKGEDQISTYTFNTGVAQHHFCKVCGIKSFYVPRSHPEAYSVNFRCVELPDGVEVTITDFDGQNWEANVEQLSHLGK